MIKSMTNDTMYTTPVFDADANAWKVKIRPVFPIVENALGSKYEYFLDKELTTFHRENGPAIDWITNGSLYEEYYYKGEHFEKEEYYRFIEKQNARNDSVKGNEDIKPLYEL